MLINDICSDLNLNDEDPFFLTNVIQHFNNSLQSMFDFYLFKYGSASIIHEQMASGSTSSRLNPELNLYNSLRNAGSKRSRGNTPCSELGRYIGTDFLSSMLIEEFSNFNILAWWKERESHFPVLAAMTCDLLSVQASMVASESAFSFSVRVLSI